MHTVGECFHSMRGFFSWSHVLGPAQLACRTDLSVSMSLHGACRPRPTISDFVISVLVFRSKVIVYELHLHFYALHQYNIVLLFKNAVWKIMFP